MYNKKSFICSLCHNGILGGALYLDENSVAYKTNLYCKWCYADGEYTLDIWKRYVEIGGKEKLEEFKAKLIDEFNTLLHIEGLPKVENLNVLSGEFINMEYMLPNGEEVKFLDDKQAYLGSQLEGETKCYGIAANMDFLLVCSYEENGENPELVIYKKR